MTNQSITELSIRTGDGHLHKHLHWTSS